MQYPKDQLWQPWWCVGYLFPVLARHCHYLFGHVAWSLLQMLAPQWPGGICLWSDADCRSARRCCSSPAEGNQRLTFIPHHCLRQALSITVVICYFPRIMHVTPGFTEETLKYYFLYTILPNFRTCYKSSRPLMPLGEGGRATSRPSEQDGKVCDTGGWARSMKSVARHSRLNPRGSPHP